MTPVAEKNNAFLSKGIQFLYETSLATWNHIFADTRNQLKAQEAIPTDISIYRDKFFETDSLAILSETSDYIVKGRFLPQKQNILVRYFGYTQTDFVIDAVYQGSSLQVGETIQIREPYYTQTLEDGTRQTVHENDYLASKEGSEYILFLDKQENNSLYALSLGTLSRYAVNDTTKTQFPNSNAADYSVENYEKLKVEVLKQYR